MKSIFQSKYALRWLIMSICITLIIIACLYITNWWFSLIYNEWLVVKKGSLEYYATIGSDTIKYFPVISATREAQFIYGIGHGEGGFNAISYVSTTGNSALRKKIDEFLIGRGYKVSSGPLGDVYRKSGRKIVIEIESIDNKRTSVMATEYYNTPHFLDKGIR